MIEQKRCFVKENSFNGSGFQGEDIGFLRLYLMVELRSALLSGPTYSGFSWRKAMRRERRPLQRECATTATQSCLPSHLPEEGPKELPQLPLQALEKLQLSPAYHR